MRVSNRIIPPFEHCYASQGRHRCVFLLVGVGGGGGGAAPLQQVGDVARGDALGQALGDSLRAQKKALTPVFVAFASEPAFLPHEQGPSALGPR